MDAAPSGESSGSVNASQLEFNASSERLSALSFLPLSQLSRPLRSPVRGVLRPPDAHRGPQTKPFLSLLHKSARAGFFLIPRMTAALSPPAVAQPPRAVSFPTPCSYHPSHDRKLRYKDLRDAARKRRKNTWRGAGMFVRGRGAVEAFRWAWGRMGTTRVLWMSGMSFGATHDSTTFACTRLSRTPVGTVHELTAALTADGHCIVAGVAYAACEVLAVPSPGGGRADRWMDGHNVEQSSSRIHI